MATTRSVSDTLTRKAARRQLGHILGALPAEVLDDEAIRGVLLSSKDIRQYSRCSGSSALCCAAEAHMKRPKSCYADSDDFVGEVDGKQAHAKRMLALE